MKRVALYLAMACLLATWSLAQNTSQAGSSGQTSSTTTTTTTTTTKKARRGSATTKTASSQLTGCLSGPNDEGVYVLKNGRHRNGVEVGGSDDLKAHVGHRVQLMGTWSTGKAIGEKEEANEANEKKEGKENEARERHFKVASIKHLADTCEVGGKSGAAASNKSGSSSDSSSTTTTTKTTKKRRIKKSSSDTASAPPSY
jgi:hypothetical protein